MVPLKPSHGLLVSQQPPAVPCGRHPVRPCGRQSQPLPCQLHLKLPCKQSQHLCRKLTPGARRQVPSAWLPSPVINKTFCCPDTVSCGMMHFFYADLGNSTKTALPFHILKCPSNATEQAADVVVDKATSMHICAHDAYAQRHPETHCSVCMRPPRDHTMCGEDNTATHFIPSSACFMPTGHC